MGKRNRERDRERESGREILGVCMHVCVSVYPQKAKNSPCVSTVCVLLTKNNNMRSEASGVKNEHDMSP